ncbi:MAG TPA: radical SAM protein [Actinomycetota bacterium]|nr:radical SAM protein [Actinomycetota bacterium]
MSGDRLFELRRRTFDTPHFRGIEFIEVEAKSIINHVPGGSLPFNWTINAYRGCSHACTYCFARSTHTYLEMDAGRDFETKIVVKVNAAELLHKELRAPRWTGEPIAMGTATDPYQRAEGKYRLTRRIIETLLEVGNPFSILTKGTLILRDLDLLQEAASVTEVATAFSVGTLDDDVWRKSEPGTPHPRKRLEAVATLNAAGIPCNVLVAPVLPGISDGRDQLKAVVEAAFDAGAQTVTPILLHLRPGVKQVYMEWLSGEFPELVPRYEDIYKGRAYAAPTARRDFGARVKEILAEARPRRRRVAATGAARARFERRRSDALERVRRQKISLQNEQLKLL